MKVGETSCDSAIGPTIATLMLIGLARLARQLAQAEAGVRDQAFDHHLSTGSGSGQPVAFGEWVVADASIVRPGPSAMAAPGPLNQDVGIKACHAFM